MARSWPMWLGLLLGLIAFAAGFALGDGVIEQWRLATRYTARVGFPLFILTYIARPLQQLRPGPFAKELLARRKWFGLGFAISHTIHFAAIVTFYRVSQEAPAPITIVGGGFAYLLLWAMALTSNAAAMKALGRWWKRLHRFGIHYLWLIFTQSYLGRLANPESFAIGASFVSIALLAGAIRGAAWLKSRAAVKAASPAR